MNTTAKVSPILMKHVVPSALADSISRDIDDAIEAISRTRGQPAAATERLITAWHGSCDFVATAVDQVLPLVRAALERTPGCEDVAPVPAGATLFCSSGTRRAGTHAHQDLGYRWQAGAKRYGFSTWLSLDPADVHSGGLLFSNGVDNQKLSVRQDFLASSYHDAAHTDAWRTGQVAPAVAPGDAICFSSTAWHAASACRPGARRRALALRWMSRSGWEAHVPVPAPAVHPSRFGMDTSGRLFCEAVEAAFPLCKAEVGEQGPRLYADWLLAHGRAVDNVDPRCIAAVRTLSDALALFEDHGGRPATFVWQAIRDEALPALQRSAATGGMP